jgi:nucleoside-diphosphate-sugar epimerase
MKILITGGCGQVGSHVAELLLSRGDSVVVVDNLATGRLEHLELHNNLTIINETIANINFLIDLFKKNNFDCIVHAAASYKDPNNWYEDTMTNSVGGANLVMLAKEYNVKRFIYYQTALCYGIKPLHNPITLEHCRFPNNSSYSISKTTTEEYLELSKINYLSFRLANVIGPRNQSGPLPIFYQRLTSGQRCFITRARRDFVYVKDLSNITIKAIDGLGFGSFNFSSGLDIPIIDLFNAIVNELGISEYPEPEIRDIGEDEANNILLDPSKTFDIFGKIQFTPLKEIVHEGCIYYKKYGIKNTYTHLKNLQSENNDV